ncbi:MAG: hypothetical protein OEZ00_00760 [Dehalococcoidia bacterium]|nr:hypothetical protein [Dehalococcoidia bacterium]
MPINRDKFNSSRSSEPMNLILGFLRSNSRNAYTQGEIAKELALRGVNLKGERVREILSALQDFDRIESKTIGGETYYGYRRAVAFKPLKRHR